MRKIAVLWLLLALFPQIASAWWNEEWGFKKKITLDSQILKQEGINSPEQAPTLIRLHTGNFLSFTELADKGKDIRILAGDEKTPLKFFIEKLDAVNEMAFIWVNLPKEVTTAPDPSIWLYFGNPAAVDGQEPAGVFDLAHVLSYTFSGKTVKDATANANNPTEATSAFAEGGLIGESASFQAGQFIRVAAAPSLMMSPSAGWTVSVWLKFDQAQTDAVLFQRGGASGNLTLGLKDQTAVIGVTDTNGGTQEFKGQGSITPAAWHHLAVSATADKITLYLDGNQAGEFPVKLGDLDGDLTIGSAVGGSRGLSGMIDQFDVYKIARDANAIKFDVKMQGASSTLLTYGDDVTPDSEEGGESYFMATLNNVTMDGWVIIGILAVMFVISWFVMVFKTLLINRVHQGNKKFEAAFAALGSSNIDMLDEEEYMESADTTSSQLLSLVSGDETYKGSSLYRIYHTGVQEMHKRLGKNSSDGEKKALSSGSMAAVKASMDAVLIRELQKLNSQMVLLTIAISGGPFLGLLGTVVGVMITFAAIAVSGEVNVNSIAPGIAAALTATVAGLAVAIPALFGYNYIGSRIKVVAADMQVFVDEFIAKLAEEHT
jgi:biopolymer transport protein ExbB